LHQSKRLLRDENRQTRVQHIKFIDRRIATKKEAIELKKNPPKKKPSQKSVAASRRAEERAKMRAEHKAKVNRNKKH
jgi:hypothetical protein